MHVDDELKSAKLHDGQIGGFGSVKNASGINSELMKCISKVGAVARQPTAACDEVPATKRRRYLDSRCEVSKLHSATGKETVRAYKQGIGATTRHAGKTASISPIVPAFRIWIQTDSLGDLPHSP